MRRRDFLAWADAAAAFTRFAAYAALAGLMVITGGGTALADVVFCNQFSQTIYVAIAYPQADGSWLSRGWLELDRDQCRPFDTALRLKTFYYRAESAPYRDTSGSRMVYSWGSDRPFAIWQDDNFNYWGAENRVLKSSLAPFKQGPETNDPDGVSATITFRLGAVVTDFR